MQRDLGTAEYSDRTIDPTLLGGQQAPPGLDPVEHDADHGLGFIASSVRVREDHGEVSTIRGNVEAAVQGAAQEFTTVENLGDGTDREFRLGRV